MFRLVSLVILVGSASAQASGTVGYARAVSHNRQQTRPALYSPLNLLDGQSTTAWCEESSGEHDDGGVIIGFKGEVSVDEVRITNGDAKDQGTFQANNRVRTLVILAGESRHTITLVDTPEPQTFKFERPFTAERAKMEVMEAVSGAAAGHLTCLSDIIFVYKGQPLNGPFLAPKLRYHRGRSLVMGTWYAGPAGAPNRFLDFYFDGTFAYSYRPFDPEEKGVEIVGDYAYEDGRLLVKTAGKGWIEAKVTSSIEQDEDGVSRAMIDIHSASLDHSFGGRWADRQ